MSNTATQETKNSMSSAQCMQQLANSVDITLQKNLTDVTHAESLIRPEPAGNCMNWVVGHLLNIYGSAMPVVGVTPVMSTDSLKAYARGSKPLENGDAIDLQQLLDAWRETHARVTAAMSTLSDEQLSARAPFSPTNNPNETVHSLLLTVLFHQSYHAGQLGVLRRISGHDGAIK